MPLTKIFSYLLYAPMSVMVEMPEIYLRDIHNNAGNLYLAYGSHAKDSIEKTPDLFYFPFCLNKIYHCLQS